jgi:hypothetical protein
MTAYTSAQANERADANQPQPLTPGQIVDKYATIFDRIWSAAGTGQYVLNIQLTDTQYSEFSPVLSNLGYGISPSLPTEVTTFATRSTGITFNGYISNAAGSAGRQLTVTSSEQSGLEVGIPLIGSGIAKGTVIEAAYSTRSTLINSAIRLTRSFTANSTNGSVVLTNVSNFTGLETGTIITGAGIPDDTIIQAVSVPAGTVTLNRAATATAAGITLTTPTGFSVDITNAGNPVFTAGQSIQIDDCFPTEYNGDWTIDTVLIGGSVTTITINSTRIKSAMQTTGVILTANVLTATGSGSVGVKTFTANYDGFDLTNVSNFENIIVGTPITGVGIPAGTEIEAFDAAAATIRMSLPAAGSGTTTLSFPTFTIFTPAVEQWPIGMEVTLQGFLPGQYNGTWTVTGSLNNTQFTVTPKLIQGWTSPGQYTQRGTVLGLGTGGPGFYTVNKTQFTSPGILKASWITVDTTQGFATNGIVQLTPPAIVTQAFQTFDNGNILVQSSRGLFEGMPIKFAGLSLGGIRPYRTYYVKNALDGILTVTEENATGIIKTWTNDASYEMTVIAGGLFEGLNPGQRYYVNSVPNDDTLSISETVGGEPVYISSQRNWINVTVSTTAANLNPAVPIFTGEALGDTGNPYVISWYI